VNIDSNIEANKVPNTNIVRVIINVEDSSDKSLQVQGKEVIAAEVVRTLQVFQQRTDGAALLSKQVTNSVTVLSPVVSPRQILKNQDQQLEDDLNGNSLVDDTSDSEDSFVDTTQFQPVISPASDAPAQQQTPMTSPAAANTDHQFPVNVVKDMEFLKESWANMAEEADAEAAANNLVDTVSDEGFTVAISKHQKKIQKKKTQSSKDSYATRSKVPPKPFK
jgi:hypothetical protein